MRKRPKVKGFKEAVLQGCIVVRALLNPWDTASSVQGGLSTCLSPGITLSLAATTFRIISFMNLLAPI